MKLEPEARKIHKLWSVRLWLLASVLFALQPVLSHWEHILPEWAYTLLASAVGIAGVIARVIPQPKLDEEIGR